MVFLLTFLNTVGEIVLFYILLQAIEGVRRMPKNWLDAVNNPNNPYPDFKINASNTNFRKECKCVDA